MRKTILYIHKKKYFLLAFNSLSQIIYFVDRFGAASVSTSHQLSSSKIQFFLSLFSPPWGGGGGGKEKLDIFGRYLLSNGHFLRLPYQIYQRNLFYLLIIVKNNCKNFPTVHFVLQLHDWMNRCVWRRFIQSQNSKEIIEEENYVIHLLHIINIQKFIKYHFVFNLSILFQSNLF